MLAALVDLERMRASDTPKSSALIQAMMSVAGIASESPITSAMGSAPADMLRMIPTARNTKRSANTATHGPPPSISPRNSAFAERWSAP